MANPKAGSSQDTHSLFSKADISEMMGITTQAFANRISRDADFPQPTFSNRNGTVSLYSKDDVTKIHEHMTRADRERIERLNKAMEALKDPEPAPAASKAPAKPAKAVADAPLEGQTAIPNE